MTTAISLVSIHKSFRGTPVLSGVDLEIREHDLLAISGANGSGKSVLLRIMSRLMTPDSGQVHIDRRYQHPRRSFPQEFGLIIDRPGYQAMRTGLENLRDLAAIRGLIGRSEIEAAMEAVGLDPAIKQRVGQYSLGMKQKLALAQAFMENQQLLLLDEPFNALDADSVVRIRALLTRLHEEGRTIVFCSHNPDDVDALATRRVELQSGRLVELADR